MGNVTDGQIDRLVKARWMAIGVSQSDLAEVLGAALQQAQQDANGSEEALGSEGALAGRLMQVAEALDIPIELFRNQADPAERRKSDAPSAQHAGSVQSLLELRLLLAFNELRDDRTKRMLVHLAEQIVKRQVDRQADGA